MNREWENEPDEKAWVTKAGLQARIYRVSWSGHLNGYVQIQDGPLYGRDHCSDNLNFNVHRGLTFSGELKNENGWWVGFYCSHCDDLRPYSGVAHIPRQVYRNMDYVTQECEFLAKQIVECLNLYKER